MTLLATATNVLIAVFPTSAVLAQAPQPSEMCAYCHALGKCVPGRQTQTYLEWRDDFYAAGLGSSSARTATCLER